MTYFQKKVGCLILKAELDKCVVLCANCHRKVTHTERGWFRGKK